MVVSNARKKIGFLHISFYKVVQIVLPIILVKIYIDCLCVFVNITLWGYASRFVEMPNTATAPSNNDTPATTSIIT